MKKHTDESSPSSEADHGGPLKDSAQQIWLAGLGAFAKAQQEGGKVFEALVADGLNMQRKTQAAAQAQMAEATQKLSAMAGGLSSRAGQHMDRLEGIFEERVAKALQRLNMASRAELQALQQQVDELQAQIGRLQSQDRPAKRPARKTPTQAPAPKPASRRTSRG